jgi:hypothetical protein
MNACVTGHVSAWFNSSPHGRISAKFGMVVKPLRSVLNSCILAYTVRVSRKATNVIFVLLFYNFNGLIFKNIAEHTQFSWGWSVYTTETRSSGTYNQNKATYDFCNLSRRWVSYSRYNLCFSSTDSLVRYTSLQLDVSWICLRCNEWRRQQAWGHSEEVLSGLLVSPADSETN